MNRRRPAVLQNVPTNRKSHFTATKRVKQTTVSHWPGPGHTTWWLVWRLPLTSFEHLYFFTISTWVVEVVQSGTAVGSLQEKRITQPSPEVQLKIEDWFLRIQSCKKCRHCGDEDPIDSYPWRRFLKVLWIWTSIAKNGSHTFIPLTPDRHRTRGPRLKRRYNPLPTKNGLIAGSLPMEILCLDIYIHIYYIIYTYSQSPPKKPAVSNPCRGGWVYLPPTCYIFKSVQAMIPNRTIRLPLGSRKGASAYDCPNWDGTLYISYITNTANIDKPTNIKFQATNKLAWWNQSNQQWDDWKPVIICTVKIDQKWSFLSWNEK